MRNNWLEKRTPTRLFGLRDPGSDLEVPMSPYGLQNQLGKLYQPSLRTNTLAVITNEVWNEMVYKMVGQKIKMKGLLCEGKNTEDIN